ncbi:MAG: hypothetical protein GXY33_19125 [Phycisphaerae bacterium]|nr:hypothetical protein [Phycisphaerae bacterium]
MQTKTAVWFVWGCPIVLAAAAPSMAQVATGREAGIWLQQRAQQLVRGSARPMADGTMAFIPQAGGGYDFFVLRDYAYLLEGCPEVFSHQELKDACMTFIDALRSDGAAVDLVTFDGTPYYMNGMGTMGENPVADGSPFMIDVGWRTYQQVQDPAFLQQIIDPLVKTMNAAPRDPANGLIYIDPAKDWDRVPYGFTDCIKKSGDELFCSLLDIRASRQLADLLTAAGRTSEAATWRAAADSKAAAVRSVFWDASTGLFKAATVRCDQPDIWGSAFAVHLGVASEEQSLAVAQYLKDHYDQVVAAGQVRHLPAGMAWEAMVPWTPAGYQNGGYWGVPTGWVAETLHRIDPELAEQTVVDMVNNFQQAGVSEWVWDNGAAAGVPNYGASATVPLQTIKALYDVPDPTLVLKEVGGTFRQDQTNVASQTQGATAFAKDLIPGYDIHQIDHLNDETYGNSNSWIAGSDSSFFGVAFDQPYTIFSLAFGRDNRDAAIAYKDRYTGYYTIQFTLAENPDAATPDSEWMTLGIIDERYVDPMGYMRHLYEFSPIAGVTGLRILVEGAGIGIDELEVYSVPEPATCVLLATGGLLLRRRR